MRVLRRRTSDRRGQALQGVQVIGEDRDAIVGDEYGVRMLKVTQLGRVQAGLKVMVSISALCPAKTCNPLPPEPLDLPHDQASSEHNAFR